MRRPIDHSKHRSSEFKRRGEPAVLTTNVQHACNGKMVDIGGAVRELENLRLLRRVFRLLRRVSRAAQSAGERRSVGGALDEMKFLPPNLVAMRYTSVVIGLHQCSFHNRIWCNNNKVYWFIMP